ncbi:MAG: M50 family metallopeptidase [Planctomycetota bacterium]|nr:M50 family metallopeptidase [Planctomycetota bacterium]
MTEKTTQGGMKYYVTILLAGLITAGLWQFPPYGDYILWPFTLLATWVHEMGHGLMAELLTDFVRLEIYEDAGGVAMTAQSQSGIVNGLIAAAGLLGPAFAGSFFIIFGRKEKTARYLLWGLGLIMGLSIAIYVRNGFGVFAVGSWVAALSAMAFFAPDKMCYFFVQFIGLQFCINNFKDFDYMFIESFQRPGGEVMLSDTGAMAQNLFLPYWVWGSLVAGSSILMLIGSLYIANRKGQTKSGASE